MEVKSGNVDLDRLVQNWLDWDEKNSKSRAIVHDLVVQEKWSVLESMMKTRLKFGTAGIRGKMGVG